MVARENRRVVLGHVAGPYGTRGWVRIRSSTEPPENILHYLPWQVVRNGQLCPTTVVESRVHVQGVIVRLEGCHDRNEASGFRGCEISVERSRLPDAGDDEIYWTDLLGSRVVTTDGVCLGEIARMMETGANDVMVVQGSVERLIPFLRGTVVRAVDIGRDSIVVDWHPDD